MQKAIIKKLCPLALKAADKAGEFRSEERE
jgi:hypothetical protein